MGSERNELGTVIRDGERLGLRYERRLAHPPQKVWRALTRSEDLRHWMPCDLVGERRAGATLVARFWPDIVAKYGMEEPDLPVEIRVWQPPEVFEWTWDGDVLRWELEATPEGTRLVFTTWLDAADPGSPRKTAAGYHACLERLVELLDEGEVAVPLVETEVEPLEALYEPFLPQ